MHIDLKSSSTLIALAVFIGCAMVSFALYDSKTHALAENQITIQRADSSQQNIYGNARAPITIVEFSDYQCPYCARLHPSLKQLVDESGGSIAWEYRHLPLRSHPLANPAAVISECLADNHGNRAFWLYTDNLLSDQSEINSNSIEQKAFDLGLTEAQLETCRNNEEYDSRISDDVLAATTLGGSGTPFSVIVYPDNTYKPVSGAVSYEQLKELVSSYVE